MCIRKSENQTVENKVGETKYPIGFNVKEGKMFGRNIAWGLRTAVDTAIGRAGICEKIKGD